uniref:Uncharacterized protein n=1 Tax=Pelusios castaneus TaxID=367368 RepID=A0A8C8RDI4_9SAUR
MALRITLLLWLLRPGEYGVPSSPKPPAGKGVGGLTTQTHLWLQHRPGSSRAGRCWSWMASRSPRGRGQSCLPWSCPRAMLRSSCATSRWLTRAPTAAPCTTGASLEREESTYRWQVESYLGITPVLWAGTGWPQGPLTSPAQTLRLFQSQILKG